MKRKLLAIPVVIALLLTFTCTAFASETKASDYIATYHASLSAGGNGRIDITYKVTATHSMLQVGVQSFFIEKYVNGSWLPCTTLLGSENPDFYSYNTREHFNVTSFAGIPGVKYRVTMTAYAQDNQGSDTSSATSNEVTCR